MVTNHATPVLEPFARHIFVSFPQFFSLLKLIANVCTKFPWYFFLMMIVIGPCAFNCMSHFISQTYIPSHRLTLKTCRKHAVFMTRLLYFNQTMIVHDATKKLQERAANLQPQTMYS
jgi:1,4-dihydroxy-2-naphthoate octaprenyltransferase